MDQEIIQNDSSFWALFELMGHNRIIGHARVWEFGQAKFFRVDVLDCEGKVLYTRALGASSIFSMTVLTEESAKSMAMQLQDSTVMIPLDLQNFVEVMRRKLIQELHKDPGYSPDDEDDDTDNEIDPATDADQDY